MSVEAFVLVELSGVDAKKAIETIRAQEVVKELYIVTGPFDIIAIIEVEDLSELGIVVLSRIRSVPGVVKTTTCIKVPEK